MGNIAVIEIVIVRVSDIVLTVTVVRLVRILYITLLGRVFNSWLEG